MSAFLKISLVQILLMQAVRFYITIIIFKYALTLQSDSQNGVVIKTYIARLISLPASCVFYGYAPSLLEDKNVITRVLLVDTENIARLHPISN